MRQYPDIPTAPGLADGLHYLYTVLTLATFLTSPVQDPHEPALHCP